jgi:hypothetical protein
MPELEEEKYVRELFEKPGKVTLRKVPESTSPTFDFEMSDMLGVSLAAVEVRRFETTFATQRHKGTMVGEFYSMVYVANAVDRILSATHDKVGQLCQYSGPRVLVFVNDDHYMNADDFFNAFGKPTVYGSGDFRFSMRPAVKPAVQARVQEEKWDIDVYVWLNRYGGRARWNAHNQKLGPFYVYSNRVGQALALEFLGAPVEPEPEVPPPTMRDALLREAKIIP